MLVVQLSSGAGDGVAVIVGADGPLDALGEADAAHTTLRTRWLDVSATYKAPPHETTSLGFEKRATEALPSAKLMPAPPPISVFVRPDVMLTTRMRLLPASAIQRFVPLGSRVRPRGASNRVLEGEPSANPRMPENAVSVETTPDGSMTRMRLSSCSVGAVDTNALPRASTVMLKGLFMIARAPMPSAYPAAPEPARVDTNPPAMMRILQEARGGLV